MRLSNIKRQLGKVVEVSWLDAAFRNAKDNDELEKLQPKELLVETVTIGRLSKVDNKAIILTTHISESHTDVYTIPHGMITKIKIYFDYINNRATNDK